MDPERLDILKRKASGRHPQVLIYQNELDGLLQAYEQATKWKKDLANIKFLAQWYAIEDGQESDSEAAIGSLRAIYNYINRVFREAEDV